MTSLYAHQIKAPSGKEPGLLQFDAQPVAGDYIYTSSDEDGEVVDVWAEEIYIKIDDKTEVFNYRLNKKKIITLQTHVEIYTQNDPEEVARELTTLINKNLPPIVLAQRGVASVGDLEVVIEGDVGEDE